MQPQMPINLVENPNSCYSGFGSNVVQLKNSITGVVVCIIGQQNGQDKVHFPSPVCVDTLREVALFLEKKKLRKALDEHDYAKAQKFADKKWQG